MRSLRIAMVSQSYPPMHGGVAEHAYHLSAELIRRGHEVTVITGGPELSLRRRGLGERRPDDSHRDVPVLRIGSTVRVPCNGGSGCVVLGWPRLGESFRRREFDLLHVHTPLVPTLPLLASKAFEGPMVATFHSAGPPHGAFRLFRKPLAPYAQRIDERIAVSRAAADYMEPFFPGRYRIIPNGIDPERFPPTPLPDERHFLTLLFVGRLDPRKGVERLLDALPHLRETLGREVRCLITGDGPLRRKLVARARELPVPVTFLGAVGRDELPAIYRLANIVVAPARVSESFGVVLLEALASGRPVVASDVRGYKEVLETCPGALIFSNDPGASPEALVEALTRAAEPSAMKTMADEGPGFAERFHWRHVAAEVEGVYASALGMAADDGGVRGQDRKVSVLEPSAPVDA